MTQTRDVRRIGRRVATALPRSPFFLALLPSLLFYVVILSRSWVPIHDAFQVTNIAYFLLNEAATHHAVPLWYPYINYGLDTNWYLVFTLGPSLATMLGVARLIGGGNLLQFYYAAMFLDELILLLGTYLLARTVFRKTQTVLFVCVAMTGSTLWFAQPWFNLHLYYFVPLAAYFVVTGCAHNELWRLLAGAAVLLISEFGSLYFGTIHALMYLLLLGAAWWAYGFDVRTALRRAGAREWLAAGACLLTAATYVVLVTHGANHINYDPGHTAGPLVTAEDFLTYGSGIGLSKFAELVTGVSWDINASVYAGVLVLALAVFGLLWAPERRMVPFLGTAVFFTLFSVGSASFVAPLAYELPGVAYYRHIGLLAPLVKVMLILLSGFGFDALLRAGNLRGETAHGGPDPYRLMRAILGSMLAIALPLVTAAVIALMSHGVSLMFAVESDATTGISQMGTLLSRAAFVGLVYGSCVGALVAASLRPRTVGPIVGFLLLFIEAVDVYSYRMVQYQMHMLPVDAVYRGLFAFGEKPFALERTRDPMSNPAFRVIASRLGAPIRPDRYEDCVKSERGRCYYDFEGTRVGVYYNTIEPVVGLDPCRSMFRVDFWLPGVDVFYRAVTGLPLHDLSALPLGYEQRRIYFPIDDHRVDKITGCGFPKFQLFSSPTVIGDEDEMAALIRSPDYSGDLLLVSSLDYRSYTGNGGLAGWNGENPVAAAAPGASTRMAGTVTVLQASANTVVVRTAASGTGARHWLYYADAWHPFWHAEVNGVEVPIVKANFGFKAVPVPNGIALVKFVYRSRIISVAWIAAQALLTATMLGVVVLAGHHLFDV